MLIVGGGIGGVATALCLRRVGLDFLLLEQAEALREVGAGIQLSPNAVRILQALGLGAALARIAVRPASLEIRSWQSGDLILTTPLGDVADRHFGAPYFHAHRADFLDLLVTALGRDRVRLGERVAGIMQDASSATAVLADGSLVSGDALIGADGIHSTVRAALFGADRARFSGNVAWRGLVPAERIRDLGVPAVSGVWWGPLRSVVHYFVSEGRLLNWIGIGRSDEPARESWSAEGTSADALREFAGWHPRIVGVIGATTHLFKTALHDREPLADWRRGRIALLGDAAHSMLPFHGQGAAQSIEDAYVLAACLAAGRPDPGTALERYVRLRKPRAEWVQRYSREAEELFHMTDPSKISRRDERLRENQRAYPTGFPPGQERLYGYDAEAALREVPAA